jgi:hypothetical protein
VKKLRQERHISFDEQMSLLTELVNFLELFLQRCRTHGAKKFAIADEF